MYSVRGIRSRTQVLSRIYLASQRVLTALVLPTSVPTFQIVLLTLYVLCVYVVWCIYMCCVHGVCKWWIWCIYMCCVHGVHLIYAYICCLYVCWYCVFLYHSPPYFLRQGLFTANLNLARLDTQWAPVTCTWCHIWPFTQGLRIWTQIWLYSKHFIHRTVSCGTDLPFLSHL